MKIRIHAGGQAVSFIHNDDLAALLAPALGGSSETRRASHVEPAPQGGWLADLSPVAGPVLGPFPRRDTALSAEIVWLNEHGVPTPCL